MTWAEAVALLKRIQAESSLRTVDLDQLGNGELVVRLKYGGGPFLLWSEQDWRDNKGKWKQYLYDRTNLELEEVAT